MKVIYELTEKKPGFPKKWSKKELNKILDEAYEAISKPTGNIERERAQGIISAVVGEFNDRRTKLIIFLTASTLLVTSIGIIISL